MSVMAVDAELSRRQPGLALPAVILVSLGLALIGQGAWIHAKALLAQVLLERAFARTLATGDVAKPWPWADTWPVARLDFPRLERSAVVLAGSSGQALAFGPGHVDATPVAGEPGTAVYAAHRDTHFSFLADVATGDLVRVIRRDGATATFRVAGTEVVPWDRSGLDPSADGRRLALVTCWPFGTAAPGPLRYIVHADLVAITPAGR